MPRPPRPINPKYPQPQPPPIPAVSDPEPDPCELVDDAVDTVADGVMSE